MPRLLLVLAAVAAPPALVGCGGTSPSGAGRVIEARSRGQLTEPECAKVGEDPANGEEEFRCSALYRGRRIKVDVDTGIEGKGYFVDTWRCGPADAHRERPVSRAERRRCQMIVGAR